jgi:tRNA threonylcarbamoyladenosine biosynthesis protein TsaB
MLAEQVQKGKGRAVTCESRVAECLDSGVSLVPEPGAEAMLAMALRRIEAEHWSDVATTDANYLRRTDAELLVKGRKA